MSQVFPIALIAAFPLPPRQLRSRTRKENRTQFPRRIASLVRLLHGCCYCFLGHYTSEAACLTTRSTRTPTGGASRLGGRRLPWFVRRHGCLPNESSVRLRRPFGGLLLEATTVPATRPNIDRRE